MTNPYSPEAMRARFADLGKQVEAIREKSKPLRDKRAQLLESIAPALAEEKDIIKAYKEVEKDLPALDRERAALARALGGKTG